MNKRQIFIRTLKTVVLINAVWAVLLVYAQDACASYSVGEFSGGFAKGTTGGELWHTVTITHSGKLILTFTGTLSSTASSSSSLWKPDKSVIITSGNASNNASISASHLAPGIYYIQVKQGTFSHDGSSDWGNYTIQAVFTNADDNLTESEPNDTIDAAKPFINNQVSGILGYTDYIRADKEDWFRYEVTHSGKLVLTFTGNLDCVSSSYLWKPDKSVIITSGNACNTASISASHLAPGIYYIQVKRGSFSYDGSSDWGNYTIQAVFTNADDNLTESEPNDTIDAAKPFINNQVSGILGYTDYVSYTDREDWFRYEVTRSGKLVLNFTYTGLSNTGVYLWKPDKSGYITSVSMSAKSLTRDKLAPGTYYIQVKRGSSDWGNYNIQAVFTPDVSAIGLQDDIVCLRILSGITVSSSEIIITDINKDGRIGMEECIYILQVVAGLRP